MKKIIFLSLLWPMVAFSQEKGIRFENNLSFEQIKAKAKTENKYIFVDCFATWCGPCKVMDRDVYTQDQVGQYFNQHFVSVKMQLDSSKVDNAETRSHYADAANLRKTYDVNAMPTFLFFSPDGNIVHKGIGELDAARFIELGKKSINPDEQYYTRLEKYKSGQLNYEQKMGLLKDAEAVDEMQTAKTIGNSCLAELMQKTREELYKPDNIQLIARFTLHPNDKGYRFFYDHGGVIDDAMKNKGYSKGIMYGTVFNDVVVPTLNSALQNNKTPEWLKLQAKVKGKYPYLNNEQMILQAKVNWYQNRQNWPLYTKHLVRFVERFGPKRTNDSTGFAMASLSWNNWAFEIFKYSNDRKELETALSWSKWLVEGEEKYPSAWCAPDIDTYANLLYKLGRKEDAIEWETKALKLSSGNRAFAEVIDKMKNNQKTWPN